MNPSLFVEFVTKWFPSLAKIVDKVNGKRNGKLTYLHKEMLRQEYSADQKWESASVDTTYVAADVVAMDSELPLKKRDSIQAANGDLPKLGMKTRLNEKQINTINILKARAGSYGQIVQKLVNDAVKCVTGIDERNEAIFLQALSEGVTLVEDENNIGTGIRVDYKYLDSNKFGVAVKWGEEGFSPISDIKRVIDKAEGDIAVIMLSKETYDLIRTSQEAKELAANYSGILVLENSKLPVPLPNTFDAAFTSETGCKFKIVNRTVKIEKDGKVKNIKPWNTNKVIFLPTEDVGALVYGTLAEETNPVNGVNYSKANAYTLVSKYSKNDPLQEFTSSQALCLPVIENVDQIYQMDITEAQEVASDEVEGDATITIWEQKYTKSLVIAALNAMNVRTSANIGDATLIEKINGLSDEQEKKLQGALTPNP